MVHKTYIIPGLSNFLDTTVLSHYPPTSMKRILAAGAISIYLNQNQSIVDTVLNNPLFNGLKISNNEGMIDIDVLRDVYKKEVEKAGFLRVHFPLLGDVDFTSDDIDTLHRCIMSMSPSASPTPSNYGGQLV
jgi:hypothetical protein